MTAAFYPVGGPAPDDRNELRYSIRSLSNAPAVTDVWLAGDIPEWYVGNAIPLEPLDLKFANMRQSWTAFVNHPDAPAEHYLFNDDHWIIEPIAGDLPTCHLGPVQAYLDVLLGKGVRETRNSATKALRDTAAWVAARIGVPDVLAYYAHTPLKFDTAKVRTLLAEYPTGQWLEPMMLYPIAGLGGVGADCGNAKVKADDSLAKVLARPMPYLSGNDDTWATGAGQHVRSLLDAPSRHEKTPHPVATTAPLEAPRVA